MSFLSKIGARGSKGNNNPLNLPDHGKFAEGIGGYHIPEGVEAGDAIENVRSAIAQAQEFLYGVNEFLADHTVPRNGTPRTKNYLTDKWGRLKASLEKRNDIDFFSPTPLAEEAGRIKETFEKAVKNAGTVGLKPAHKNDFEARVRGNLAEAQQALLQLAKDLSRSPGP